MHAPSLRRIRRFSGLAALGLAIMAIAVPSAVSKPRELPETMTITATKDDSRQGGRSAQAAPITCTMYVDNPHRSTHVPGNVNVISRIECTSVVARLWIEPVTLYRNFTPIASGSNYNMGQRRIQANAANTCVSANHFGRAQGGVVFPPNYNPAGGSYAVQGQTVFVLC